MLFYLLKKNLHLKFWHEKVFLCTFGCPIKNIENHPHSALGYHSPDGIPAAAGIANLRYKSCPEMAGQDHDLYFDGSGEESLRS